MVLVVVVVVMMMTCDGDEEDHFGVVALLEQGAYKHRLRHQCHLHQGHCRQQQPEPTSLGDAVDLIRVFLTHLFDFLCECVATVGYGVGQPHKQE